MSVTSGGQTVSFAYRPDGLRYSKTSGSGTSAVTHKHLWDGQNIVAEIGATNTINARYIRGLGLVARKIDNNHQYYQFNAHGDVLHLLDANGNMLVDYRYDAFGNQSNPVATDTNPFRFCGEYFDLETNCYYLRARYYNPFLGRFTTEDSARNGLNWYIYCANNPILFFDPSGQKSEPSKKDLWALEREKVEEAYKYSWNDFYGNAIGYDFLVMNMLYAEDLGIAPDDLMTVMATESGFETGYSRFGSGAVGLIQFTNAAVEQLRISYDIATSLDEISVMTALEQLDYVHKLYSLNRGKVHDYLDLYALNFAPYSDAVGDPNIKTVIYSNLGENSGLDKDYDGVLTKNDLRLQVEALIGHYRKPKT